MDDIELVTAKDLDPNDLDNYRWYTLPVGLHHMDGGLALWFSRSRQTSSDFERNRRQQLVLRAIWSRVKEMGMVSQLPMLWEQVIGIVATNLTLGDVVGMTPVALALDGSRMRSYFLGPDQVTPWTTDGGASVLMPKPEKIRHVVELLIRPTSTRSLRKASLGSIMPKRRLGPGGGVAWAGKASPVDAGHAGDHFGHAYLITGGAKRAA
jgi:hypothetical protein